MNKKAFVIAKEEENMFFFQMFYCQAAVEKIDVELKFSETSN